MYPPTQNALAERYRGVLERIRNAAERCHRQAHDVHLVAVSKGRSIEDMQALYALGQRDFGENYASELEQKRAALTQSCPGIRWHYLGRIQSNKAKLIAACDVLHTLDSVEHAHVLQHARGIPPMPPCFVQVNLSGEPNRSGVPAPLLQETFSALLSLGKIRLLGLMAILPLQGERSHWFALLNQFKTDIESKLGLPKLSLSLGMSDDFEEAVLAGATHLRIGAAIFGPTRQ